MAEETLANMKAVRHAEERTVEALCIKAHFDALESGVIHVGEPVVDWREFRRTRA